MSETSPLRSLESISTTNCIIADDEEAILDVLNTDFIIFEEEDKFVAVQNESLKNSAERCEAGAMGKTYIIEADEITEEIVATSLYIEVEIGEIVNYLNATFSVEEDDKHTQLIYYKCWEYECQPWVPNARDYFS